MKENLKMVNLMEMGNLLIKMEIFMKDSGKRVLGKERENTFFRKMEMFWKGNSEMMSY